MDRYCYACHAEDAMPGELSGYGFDTCAKTRRNERAFRRVVFEEENMPPGGAERLPEWAQLTMKRWYEQGGTCD